MRKFIPLITIAAISGCVVRGSDRSDPPPPPPPPPVNHAPYVHEAIAGVYLDPALREDVWYFDATVDDPDGAYDVISVWADVYDDYSDEYIETFELFPTDDPYRWYSDWLGYSTHLDPWYELYAVDIVAYDAHGATGYVIVNAQSY